MHLYPDGISILFYPDNVLGWKCDICVRYNPTVKMVRTMSDSPSDCWYTISSIVRWCTDQFVPGRMLMQKLITMIADDSLTRERIRAIQQYLRRLAALPPIHNSRMD
jgi:hypothetical protein